MSLQISAFKEGKTLPIVIFRYWEDFVIRRFAEFVSQFQEEEVCELFKVIAVAHAVVTESVTEVPYLAYYCG